MARKASQQTGAGHFSFMSDKYYNIIGFGGRALSAQFAEPNHQARP